MRLKMLDARDELAVFSQQFAVPSIQSKVGSRKRRGVSWQSEKSLKSSVGSLQ